MTVKADPNTGTQPVNQMLTITLANGNSKEVPVTLLGVGGGEGGTYTLIDNLSNLSAGTYLMAGFRAKGEAHPVLLQNRILRQKIIMEFGPVK